MRGQGGAAVDVVEALELARLPVVDLEDHPVGLVEPRLVVAHRAARDEQSVGQDRRHLDDGDVERAVEAEPHLLGRVAQVGVDVVDLAGVDLAAQRRVGVVGQALGDGVRLGQDAVGLGSGGGTGPQADAEVLAGVVCGAGSSGECRRHGLGVAGAGEPAHPDVVAGADVLGGCLGGGDLRGQEGIRDPAHCCFVSFFRPACGGRACTMWSTTWSAATCSRSPVRRSRTSTVPSSARSLPDHDDGRDADQLGVLELHAGADLAGAVVVEHLDALARQLVGDPLGRGEDRLVLAGGDQVHVGGRDLARPAQAHARRGCPRRSRRPRGRRRCRRSPW